MIRENWDKIAYAVQLLASCLLFVIPMKKRKIFPFSAVVSGIVLVGLSFFMTSLWKFPSTGLFLIVYWSLYILICIVFVWACLACPFSLVCYCAVCACGVQHIAFDLYLIQRISGNDSAFISFLIYAVIYVLFYIFFSRKLFGQGVVQAGKQTVFPIATMIVLIWILSVLENSVVIGGETGMWYRIIYRISDGLCCFYVLWIQLNQKERMRLQRELDGVNAIWRQQKKQYEITSDTIESINRKCHDLKHQIRMIRKSEDNEEKKEFLSEIENDIMIYDTALKTGNKALDTVLMEKGLFCRNHGIQWSFMADGTKLEFMKLEDIYSMFGNALDNAITAVLMLNNPQKRIISLKSLNQNSIIIIQVQNYFEGELQFQDGLPVTTKQNRREHGYGLKSIRYTAEKYNGTITVQAKDGIFTLQILIPSGERKEKAES